MKSFDPTSFLGLGGGPIRIADTYVDRVSSRIKGVLPDSIIEETSVVMTRRIRFLLFKSGRTTVLPGPDCANTPGFIVFWNTADPAVLEMLHIGMVQLIEKIGFTEPAVWCDRRPYNRNPKSLDYFWEEKLGDLFRYYKKAT